MDVVVVAGLLGCSVSELSCLALGCWRPTPRRLFTASTKSDGVQAKPEPIQYDPIQVPSWTVKI